MTTKANLLAGKYNFSYSPGAIAMSSHLPEILRNDIPLDGPSPKAIVLSSFLSKLVCKDASIEPNQV